MTASEETTDEDRLAASILAADRARHRPLPAAVRVAAAGMRARTHRWRNVAALAAGAALAQVARYYL